MTTPTASSPTSWAGRYGQVLLTAGVAPIPFALFAYQAVLDLAAAEVWFVARVLAGAWDAGLPRVSLRALAAQSGVSLTQLHRYQATLLARQYLALQPRFDGRTGGQLPSGYDFGGLFARLEELLAAAAPVPNPLAEDDGPPPPDPAQAADTSLVARYGRLIAGAGLAALPQALFTQQRALALKPAQVWFVGYLLAHRWTTDFPYPSLKKMAARTGYSQEYLHTLKDELVAHGYLRVVPRRGPQGERINNGYDLSSLFAALAAGLAPPNAERGGANAESRVGAPTPAVPARRRGRRSQDGPPQAAGWSDREHETTKPEQAGISREWDVVPRSAFALPTSAGAGVGSEGSSWMNSSWIDSSSSQLDGIPPSQVDGIPPSQVDGIPPSQLDGTPLSQMDGIPLAPGTPSSQVGGTPPSQVDGIPPSQVEDTPAPPAAGALTGGSRPDSAWLRRLTADLTRELEAPLGRPAEATRTEVAANSTQTLALWRSSGLPEAAFADLMQAARRRTQAAKGHQRGGGLRRPMAYFFTVLADLANAELSKSDGGTRNAELPKSDGGTRNAELPKSDGGTRNAKWTARCVPPAEVSLPPPPTALDDETIPGSGLLPPSALRHPTSAYSPYIAGVMLDYGRELGAGPAGTGHVTQALRLWEQSGLGETPFVGLLHAARRQVRGSTLPGGARLNTLPQFFTVLQTLLAGAPAAPAQGGS